MFVTVVVVMCKLLTAQATILPDRDCTPEEMGIEEIVVDSDIQPELTFFDCLHGEAKIAKWIGEHPIYHSPRWRLGRTRCVPGHYEIKRAI